MEDLDFQPKMVGRENELRELQAYLDKAEEGEGNTIFVSGEAGIGKTRLVEELKQIAQSKGFQILSGNCMHESLTPFMPIMEALRSGGMESLFAEEAPKVEAVYLVTNAGILIRDVVREETKLDSDVFASMFTTVTDFVSESLSKLSGEEEKGTLNSLGYQNYRILIESLGEINLVVILTGRENEFLLNDMREILTKIIKAFKKTLKEWGGDEKKVAGIEELLRPLITSGKYDGIYYGKDDPKARRNLLFENVSMGLARSSQTSPTLLCIEDLQWVDPSSLALMHYIARNTRESGLFILGTYRPEDVAATDGKGHPLVDTMQSMNREDLYEKMELKRLPKESINDFLFALLGKSDLAEDFKNKIHKETEGNPLFVIELIKYLVDEEYIKNINGTWKLAKPLGEGTIPSKVYNVISRRLNRVNINDRNILDYASILGEVFDPTLLASTLYIKRLQLLERLRYLEQTHRLIHPINGNFKFDHAKIKEVLYWEIPEELGKEYHLKIAETLETLNKNNLDEVVGDLAFHYYRCRNKEKALLYLIKAADKAKKDYSNEEAIKFYNYALEFEKDSQKRMGILEDLGAIYDLIGNYEMGIDSNRKARELTEDPKKKAEVTANIGSLLEKSGKYEDAMKSCNEALNLVKGEDCKGKALALHNLGHLIFMMGDYNKSVENLNQSLDIYEKIDDPVGIATTCTSLGNVYDWRGEFDIASDYLKKSLNTIEKSGNLQGIAAAILSIGIIYEKMGDFQASLNQVEKAYKIYEKIGDQHGCLSCLATKADINVWKGFLPKAFDYLNQSIELSEKIGDIDYISIRFNSAAGAYIFLGEYEKSIEYYKKSLETAQKIGSPLASAAALSLIGSSIFYKGDLDSALDYLKKCHEITHKIGVPWGIGSANGWLGRLYIEMEDYDKSIKHQKIAFKTVEKMGAKWAMCFALSAMAKAHFRRGDTEKAWDYANRAYELSAKIETRWHLGEAGMILGMLHREENDWEKSEDYFRECIDIFDKIPMLHELAESHFEFGLMWKAKGKNDKAKEHMKKSIELYEKLRRNKKREKVEAELKTL
jgi:predicted ATPase